MAFLGVPEFLRSRISPVGEPSLAYVGLGRGPDVVLLHGALSVSDDLVIGLGPLLAERFRITAFDRPGHGRSGRLGPTGTPWRQAQALRAGVRAMELVRPVLVGHSHGAAAALAYALQFPDEIAGVVALAPPVFPEVRLEHLFFGPRAAPATGWILNTLASRVLDPLLLPLLWRAMFLPQAMPSAFVAGFPFEIVAAPAQKEAEGEDAAFLIPGLACSALNYARCQVPIRILAGDQDMVVNNRLHGALLPDVAANAQYRELPGIGHMLHHFAQAEVLKDVEELAG